jgi:two-component system, response regulator PdtaR
VCISSSDRKAGVEIAAEHVNMNQCSPSRRPRALIVEDEVMIALGLQAEMESMGFEVCGLAANARQAISLAMEDKPDLVVMDIYLNGARDGIEAARSLRETFGTPIVFISAYTNDNGIMDRVQRQVPDAPVLAKPLYGDHLACAIERLNVQRQWASTRSATTKRERQFTIERHSRLAGGDRPGGIYNGQHQPSKKARLRQEHPH